MKPTTYIIGALVIAGAAVSGIMGYMSSKFTDGLELRTDFDGAPVIETLEPIDSIAVRYSKVLPDNVCLYFRDGIPVTITEDSLATAPSFTTPGDWMKFINLSVDKDSRTLEIIVDGHGLAETLKDMSIDEEIGINLDAPDMKIIMPAGTLHGVSGDKVCRLNLKGMNLPQLNAVFNNILCLENCTIGELYAHIPINLDDRTTLSMPASSLDLVAINAIDPQLSIEGDCNVNTFKIDVAGTVCHRQWITFASGVQFKSFDWNPSEDSNVNVEFYRLGGAEVKIR